MIISLSGFMGCGKSTVGRELAKALGCPFVDLDEYIVSCEGRSIPEIFAEGGEPAFRAIELQALRSVLASYGTGLVTDGSSASGGGLVADGSSASGGGLVADGSSASGGGLGASSSTAPGSDLPSARSLVLSLGGGTLTTPECRELVKAQCFNIYLRTSAATIRSRLVARADASAVVSPSATADANGNPTADVKADVAKADASAVVSAIATADANGNPTSDVKADVAKAPLRAGRPLLRPDFEKLLESRRPIYESAADVIIDTDSLSPAEIASFIAQDLP